MDVIGFAIINTNHPSKNDAVAKIKKIFKLEYPNTFKVNKSLLFLILTINLLIIYLIIKSDKIRSLFYVIILGGSLGNLFDRFYYTAVPDFIDLNYKGFHWFIFNIADIFISLGIICLICFEFLDYKKKNNV